VEFIVHLRIFVA